MQNPELGEEEVMQLASQRVQETLKRIVSHSMIFLISLPMVCLDCIRQSITVLIEFFHDTKPSMVLFGFPLYLRDLKIILIDVQRDSLC